MNVGVFASEEAAAAAYDSAARKLHGERARLNFPIPGERSSMGRSIYRGISWQAKVGGVHTRTAPYRHSRSQACPQCNKYECRLKFQGKMRYVGVFTSEVVAAAAWDIEALRLRGKASAASANFPHLLPAYEAAIASGDDSVVAAYKVMGVAHPAPRAPAAPRRSAPAPARTRKTKRAYDEDEDEDESEDWQPGSGSHARALSAPSAGRPSASAFLPPPLPPPLPAPPSLGDTPMQGLGFGALMSSSEEGGGSGDIGGLGGVHPSSSAPHLRASSSPPRLGDSWVGGYGSYEEMGGLGGLGFQ